MVERPRNSAGHSRRQLIVGGSAVAGAAWVAPSILRFDRAVASPGSCGVATVTWTSVTGTGPWTATGTSGTVTVTATVTASSAGTTQTYLSGSRVIMACGPGHSIGDTFDVSLSFSDSSGTICSASSRILDIDRNGRGLGCATNSRFQDEISNLTGAGLSTATEGGVSEVTPGLFRSTLRCKTTDTENLVVTWAVAAGVSTGGFRWTMGTPPGTDTTLDFQLIKLDPFTVCTTSVPAGVSGAAISAGASQREQD